MTNKHRSLSSYGKLPALKIIVNDWFNSTYCVVWPREANALVRSKNRKSNDVCNIVLSNLCYLSISPRSQNPDQTLFSWNVHQIILLAMTYCYYFLQSAVGKFDVKRAKNFSGTNAEIVTENSKYLEWTFDGIYSTWICRRQLDMNVVKGNMIFKKKL